MAHSHAPADPFQNPKAKRRIVFVKRGFQTRYVIWVFAFVLIAITAIGLDFYFHFGREVQNFMDPSLYDLFKTDSYVFMFKLIIYMVGVTLFAIIGSHKLAGPIYRFERSARVVGSGDLTHRIKTRHGDELGDLRDEFNMMVESVQRLVSQDAHLALRVSKHLGDLMNSKHLNSEVSQKLHQIKSDVDLLHKGFKI